MKENHKSSSIGDGPTMKSQSVGGGGGRRLAAGDVILGRYMVARELGEGGMGVVYQCLDMLGNVEVAVKCLPPEVSRNADEMEGIRANYQLVRKLRHPVIAGVTTLERDDATGDYYLVMDLASGVTLKRWMRDNPNADFSARLAVLRQVAAALDYAHAEKVIHRDVKPENVMVDPKGRVKVLDFGLAARIRSSLSRTSDGVTSKSGTPAYKSPEQWLGRPQEAPADIYAFGVMCYKMFAGRLPFDNDDPVVLGHAVLSAPVEPVKGLSDDANAALAKVLAKDPKDRFMSCMELVAVLDRERSNRRKKAGGARFGRVVKGLLVVVLLGIAFGGGMWYDRLRQRRARARTRTTLEPDATVAEKAILGETSEVFIEYSPKPKGIHEEMSKVEMIKLSFGLTNGADLAAIPYDERRAQMLKKYPEIKDVVIDRQLPRRVNINVKGRMPAVCIAPLKAKIYTGLVADYDGVVFRHLSYSLLPVIRVADETRCKRGDRLEGLARAALQLVHVLADAADGKSDAAPELANLHVREIDTSKTDYLLVTLSDSSTVEIAWDRMWEDSDISRQSLQRQLKHLAQAIASNLMPRATRWIVTEYDQGGRVYAADPARRGER